MFAEMLSYYVVIGQRVRNGLGSFIDGYKKAQGNFSSHFYQRCSLVGGFKITLYQKNILKVALLFNPLLQVVR